MNWLGSAVIFLQWFKFAHIYIQVSTLHNGVRKESIGNNFKQWIYRQVLKSNDNDAPNIN